MAFELDVDNLIVDEVDMDNRKESVGRWRSGSNYRWYFATKV